jgi:sulfopyruvate decarboxylase TPP-binding subunit
LDGKNTFHATQMAAWQRGIGNGLQLDKLLPSSRDILQIPPELDTIVPTNVPEGKSVPLFNENVEIETFNTTEDEEEDARVAAATDMAFQIFRNGKECHKHGRLSTRL